MIAAYLRWEWLHQTSFLWQNFFQNQYWLKIYWKLISDIFYCLVGFWTLPYEPKAQWSNSQKAKLIGFVQGQFWGPYKFTFHLAYFIYQYQFMRVIRLHCRTVWILLMLVSKKAWLVCNCEQKLVSCKLYAEIWSLLDGKSVILRSNNLLESVE